MISPDLKTLHAQVQQKAPIVSIISSYLLLQPSRRGMRGNCPFHADQTNSLMVSAEKNIFKCFGCGEEGGPAEFISRIGNISIEKSIELLAGGLNITQTA
ncbi:CHC2 zinc finger domain-containing protein [uncultured Mucilaginibacter sp.]|uniref:CHC2 zinc finger domain-containing protein n=1 Tax=uncultured Mucilaginibacter sp. TaxID=797541 RepID=UPI0025D0E27A|nr:CHC2 zinc finger domain-containing protein [uncultured Mucilaginibacter sp.]